VWHRFPTGDLVARIAQGGGSIKTDHSHSVATNDSKPRPGAGAAAVYWVLLALAISTLAACVLLPEWRDLETLAALEQAEADRADQMDQLVARERRNLSALTSDPAAMVRLAQRDLTMVRSGEIVVPVSLAGAHTGDRYPRATADATTLTIAPPASPRISHQWDRVFCNNRLRPAIIALSIALAGAAFALFGFSKPS